MLCICYTYIGSRWSAIESVLGPPQGGKPLIHTGEHSQKVSTIVYSHLLANSYDYSEWKTNYYRLFILTRRATHYRLSILDMNRSSLVDFYVQCECFIFVVRILYVSSDMMYTENGRNSSNRIHWYSSNRTHQYSSNRIHLV
jgi:hypothetical protein